MIQTKNLRILGLNQQTVNGRENVREKGYTSKVIRDPKSISRAAFRN